MDTTSYDVVIVGAGVAGALCACRIKQSKPQARVLLIDAGDNGIDDAHRAGFVDAYQLSASKNVPSPYAALRNDKDGYAPWVDVLNCEDEGSPRGIMRRSPVTGSPALVVRRVGLAPEGRARFAELR
ncbi:lycopene cyclase family protein [Streptomyces sp. NBC_01244]|uniref:lycopene cyclase family protein n=1 Tax=Streptomyces sp. NBC_01244 TaxID=2903797 RepID=UPI002E14B780|nr:NAD(P)-binding protein [Streptomyces sp. NBC_01244]